MSEYAEPQRRFHQVLRMQTMHHIIVPTFDLLQLSGLVFQLHSRPALPHQLHDHDDT